MKASLKFVSFLVFSFLIFSGCENEPLSPDIEVNAPTPTPGGGENVAESGFVGTWEVTDQIVVITQELSATIEGFPPINSVQTITAEKISGDATVTFSEDGTYTSSGDVTLEVTGEQDGVAIPESETISESGFASGTWSVSNGNLSLTTDGTEVTYVISSFSGNNATLFSNEALPSFAEILNSGEIPDITNIPGFEDLPGLNFDVEQSYEVEVSLTKI